MAAVEGNIIYTTQHNTTQHNTTQHNTKQNKTKQRKEMEHFKTNAAVILKRIHETKRVETRSEGVTYHNTTLK